MIFKKMKRKLFFKDDTHSPVTEALRLLRTNIHFIDDKKNKIVVVTSSVPKEGKSFIAANYAMSEAATGKKVLLIDCDVRRPRVHTSFDLEDHSGMEEVLLGIKKAQDVIVKNIEKNLDILPSKHLENNVTELLLGGRMEEMLQNLKVEYDFIILDTPPLIVTTDAAILSKYSDGVIFVNGYDMVSKKDLIHARGVLASAGANLYGMVVNKVDRSGYGYGNYGYYKYNYKYYQEYIDGAES